MILSHSYAELTGNNIRSEIQGAVKDKVKVKTTKFSRFFWSIDCKPPPGDVADMGILMRSEI